MTTPGRHWIQWPRFPIRGDILAIGVHMLFLFCIFYSEISQISVSGLLDLISWKVGHAFSGEVDTSHQVWSWSDHPLQKIVYFTYDTFTSNTLRYIVTLTIDLLTLNSCQKFFFTRSNLPPNLSILSCWVMTFTLWLLLAIQIAYS